MQLETAALKSALEKVSKAVGKNQSMMPALSFIKLDKRSDRLHLTATDLELRIEDSVPVGGNEEDFTIGVLAEEFTRHVAKYTCDDLTAILKDDVLVLKGDGKTAKVSASNMDDFPTAAESFDNGVYFSSAGDFLDAVRRVPFANPDKARGILTAVHMYQQGEKLVVVGVEGNIMGETMVAMTHGENLVGVLNVPDTSLKAVLGALGKLEDSDIQIDYGPAQVRFKASSVTITTRMLVGKYPNYRAIMPQAFTNEFSVDVKEFQALVDQAAISAQKTDYKPSIDLDISPAFLVARTRKNSGGEFHNEEEPLAIERYGDCEEIQPIKLTFSIPYVSQALKAVSAVSDRVVIRQGAMSKPIIQVEAEGVSDYAIVLVGVQR